MLKTGSSISDIKAETKARAPKVSVVISTYNKPDLLTEAVNSVLNQTFTDFELIIVDDESIDNTREVIADFQKKSDKIRYVFQKNGGPSAGRNAGIRESRGEYIAFLDHDDLWVPEKLMKQVKFLDDNKNYAMVYADAYEFNGDIVTEERKLREIDRRNMSGHILKNLILRCFIPAPSVMIRKSAVDETGFFDTRCLFSQDWNYWLRVAKKHEIGYLDEVLAGYRRHSGNITNNSELHIRERHWIVDNAFDSKIMPEGLAKCRRLAHAFIYFEEAEEYLMKGEHAKAMPAIIKSLRCNPLKIKTYYLLIKSFLPPAFLAKIRHQKDKLSKTRKDIK